MPAPISTIVVDRSGATAPATCLSMSSSIRKCWPSPLVARSPCRRSSWFTRERSVTAEPPYFPAARRVDARSAARRIALTMLDSLAMPRPAMSNAVP